MSSMEAHLMMRLSVERQPKNQGFTLVEVMVGILLTLIFTAVAMQAIVMATAIKVKGDELTEATNWMQQDLETVKSKANSLDYASGSYSALSSVCTGGTSGGYANRLQTQTIDGGTIGASTTISKQSSIGARPYNLVRTTSPVSANTLSVSYNVFRSGETTSLASSYTQVIPGAAFSCRQ